MMDWKTLDIKVMRIGYAKKRENFAVAKLVVH